MLFLKAITVGTAVPPHHFEAVVHSVFDGAANLSLGAGGRLLTLVAIENADLPQGIRLETPPGFSFEAVLQPGDAMISKDGILVDEHKNLAVDLRPAKRWKCSLPSVDLNNPSVAAAWIAVWKLLDQWQRRVGTEIRVASLLSPDLGGQSATAREIGVRLRGLAEDARRREAPVEAHLAGLIGLGPGLTPAGDDILVGFLTGLRCSTDKRKERLAYLSALGKMAVRLSRQTNDISRTYLYHAAHGRVSSRLVALAEALESGDANGRLLQITENIMRIGHSSGMDMLSGYLVGLFPERVECCSSNVVLADPV